MQRRIAGRSPHGDVEERLQRALQENAQLKTQKNELEDKLKKVQTQFRRLSADWRQSQEGQPPPVRALSTGSTGGRASGVQSPPSARPSSAGAAVSHVGPAFPAPRTGGTLPSLHPNLRTGAAAAASSRVSSLAGTPMHKSVRRFSTASAPGGGSSAPAGPSAPAVPPAQQVPQLAPSPSPVQMGGNSGVREAEWEACKAALAHAQLELQQLRAANAQLSKVAASAASPIPASNSNSSGVSVEAFHAAQQEAATLREQLQRVREELNQSLFTQQQLQAKVAEPTAGIQQQLQGSNVVQHELEAQYRTTMDTLMKEKQELALKVRLLEVDKQALEVAATSGNVDLAGVSTLQDEVHRKASELTVLHSRLQYAQSQVETLKGECGRLVEELRHATTAHADTKKALFALEHETANLRVKSSTLDEVELALQRKSEENAKLEAELLKLIGSLQSCNRETEAAVRQEFQARLAEVQEMRDAAERERREVERKLLHSQHDLADVRRTLESAQEDLHLYKGEVAKMEKEKSVLSAQIAFGGAGASAANSGLSGADLTDEDVHRALAVAAMKKRGGTSFFSGGIGGDNARGAAAADKADTKEAKAALDLYEALNWDGDWEQGQLREALATAVMDLELAETRCQQMSEQLEQHRTSLHRISAERDVLLEEGIALRGRITHVQTIFAKQQLMAYRAAAEAASSRGVQEGLISFSIRGLHSQEQAMCRALGIADAHAPVAFFFTLDGLSDYETMIGPTLHALDDVVDVRFQYEDLQRNSATLAAIEQTTFTFQLHCTSGGSCRLVAMADLPGMALLSAREMSMEDTLRLIDGTGEVVGTILLEFCCSHLALPVLLDAPLTDPKAGAVTLSASEIKSTMVALRTVHYLRIQVFRAQGLAGSVEDNTLPQPYVFYTATSPLNGLNCVRDTTVHPSSRAFTTDPVFDAAPVDHRVVMDASLIRFIAFGTVTFVVFDERAKEVQLNLGTVEVALRPLLESPFATTQVTEALHPQGTLSVGLSWVSGA